MIEILLLILRKDTPPGILQKTLRELTQDDWEELIEQAGQHGLLLIIYERLHTPGYQDFVPNDIQKELTDAYLIATGRNMRMLHHAGVILKAFQKHLIKVIVLKGIYLIESVYEKIGLRVFWDLDLLVQRKDLTKALKIMQSMGYDLTTYFDPLDLNRDIKHIPPMKKPQGPFVEIHWTILDEEEPFTIDITGVWLRAIPALASDVEVLALSYEDLLLHLCTHTTYQHQLIGGLRNFYEISKVIDTFKDKINWNTFITITKSWSIERVICLSFLLLEQVLGVLIPEVVKAQLPFKEIEPQLITEAKGLLFSKNSDTTFEITPDLAKLSLTHSPLEKLKIILRRVFIPKNILARVYNTSPNSLKIYGCYIRRFKDLFNRYAPSARLLVNKDQRALRQAEAQRVQEQLVSWMGKR